MKKKKILEINRYSNNAEFQFKAGQRLFNSGQTDRAFSCLSKAVALEPYNADYKFSLACLLSEMSRHESSTALLLDILKNIDPGYTECYFGIGCNYFEKGNLEKAREHFEKYLHFDPTGQYVFDAHDVLYYLDIYGDSRLNGSLRRKAVKLAQKGEKLLLEGDPEKAAVLLDKALEYYPGLIGPRIILANIYFAQGDREKAISMAKSVLSLDSGNIEANCRLASFYAESGMKARYRKKIRELADMKPQDGKDWELLRETCLALGEKDILNRIGSDGGMQTEVIPLSGKRSEKYKL